MRYAFRTAVFFSFCLTLALASSLLPAYARGSGETGHASTRSADSSPEITAEASTALAPKPTSETLRQSGVEQAPPAQTRPGWVKVESGSRQAYVGIHGGTAPLSLMHSTDGVLFAFTGRTGNDFMQVLKGGNASRVAAQPPPRNNAEDPGRPVDQTGQRPAKGAVPALPEHQVPSQAVAQTPADRIPGSASSVENISLRPDSADKPLMPMPPNSEKLIFASAELASRGLSEGYLPFGLTPSPDMPPATEKKEPAPLGTPLKLGSYQKILSYSGNR